MQQALQYCQHRKLAATEALTAASITPVLKADQFLLLRRSTEAATNEKKRRRWIKFGESSFDASPGIRCAIWPHPGRIVLFSSYVWRGTIPFHSDTGHAPIALDRVSA